MEGTLTVLHLIDHAQVLHITEKKSVPKVPSLGSEHTFPLWSDEVRHRIVR